MVTPPGGHRFHPNGPDKSWIIGAPHVILKIYKVYRYDQGRPYTFLKLHGGAYEWNYSHSWLNLVSSVHYQGKKRGKQFENGCGTGITNQRKSAGNNFQYLKCKSTVSKKLGDRSRSPHLHILPFLTPPEVWRKCH